eukprot:scaffold3759_cov61-Cyclotella_meneghiniana.AAC.4
MIQTPSHQYVPHFGGTKKMLGNWQDSSKAMFGNWQDTSKSCPSCGQPNEDKSYSARRSAHVVAQWLLNTNMDEELAEDLMEYIIAGGDKQLVDAIDCDSKYADYAPERDQL